MKAPAWLGLVGLSVAITLFFEWHTDEVTVVLAVMCLLALLLGALKPERALVSGAAIGFSIIIAHALSESAGVMRPHYVHTAPKTGDWIAMAIAGAFVTGVAWIGRRAHSLMARDSGQSRGRP